MKHNTVTNCDKFGAILCNLCPSTNKFIIKKKVPKLLKTLILSRFYSNGGQDWIRTSEPLGTELQSVAFSHFATCPIKVIHSSYFCAVFSEKKRWCRLKDLNPQPTDYKSVALPIELSRQNKWWRITGSNR